MDQVSKIRSQATKAERTQRTRTQKTTAEMFPSVF